MAFDNNPLKDMKAGMRHEVTDQSRPDDSFRDTALPGFQQLLNARRAIREFNGEPVPEDIMRECLKDAILSPSSSNLQTYELYWVRDIEKKRRVAEYCLEQPAATTAGELIVAVARVDKWQDNLKKLIGIMTYHGEKTLPKPLNDYYTNIVPRVMTTDPLGIHNLVRRALFFWTGRNKPMVRVPVNRADHRIYGHIQVSLVAQTLMLSVAAHGYESCPIGGMDTFRIGKLLKLPNHAEVSMVIAIGRGTAEGLYGRRIRLPDQDLIKEV